MNFVFSSFFDRDDRCAHSNSCSDIFSFLNVFLCFVTVDHRLPPLQASVQLLWRCSGPSGIAISILKVQRPLRIYIIIKSDHGFIRYVFVSNIQAGFFQLCVKERNSSESRSCQSNTLWNNWRPPKSFHLLNW